MKKHLTHFLLAFLLLCAQFIATAHAVEHVLEEGKGVPAHTCVLCIAGHDLGAGLVGKLSAPPAATTSYISHLYTCTDRGALPAPQARQQSPPCT